MPVSRTPYPGSGCHRWAGPYSALLELSSARRATVAPALTACRGPRDVGDGQGGDDVGRRWSGHRRAGHVEDLDVCAAYAAGRHDDRAFDRLAGPTSWRCSC